MMCRYILKALAITLIPSIAFGEAPPVPEVAIWEQQMISYGKKHCATLQREGASFDEKLAATYYDAEWVYYQIGYYTGDVSWYKCAEAASRVYRDGYVLPANGTIPGYWNFTQGLAEGFARRKDAESKKAVILIAQNAAYARDTTPVAETASVDLSREVSYAILSYINAELIGEPRRERLKLLVDQALGHLNSWFVTKKVPFVRPFMVGLTAHALITYNKRTPDSRVLPALKAAADSMWEELWVPTSEAFRYTDRVHESGGTDPTPDLNLLIAPLYAWLFHETGDVKYRIRADQIFSGGVKKSWLEGAKQFNQNYRWSFDYIKWRNEEPKSTKTTKE